MVRMSEDVRDSLRTGAVAAVARKLNDAEYFAFSVADFYDRIVRNRCNRGTTHAGVNRYDEEED